MTFHPLMVFGIALLASVCNVAAQSYPAKPLRIVVPFSAGSGADANPRFYGELVSKLLGQSIVVDNRPGGSGVIAVQTVKGAAADGYTLLTGTTSTIGVNPVVMKDLPYDPAREFRPVILFGFSPTAFVVSGNSPSKSLKEFAVASKKAGVPVSVGNYSAGYELLSYWFGIVNGLPITPVPYKGSSQVMTDVIGGQIASGMIDSGGAAALIKEGRMRALVITADSRHPILPDVPTMKESGFPDFVSYSWSSIFVRSETPDAIVDKLYGAFKGAMDGPEGRAYQASRTAIIVNYTPKEIRAFVAADAERFRKIAQAAGIKPR